MTLWTDILEQYEHPAEESLASHFTGAIVTAPARSVPVGVAKHLVIDGQQRLTTVAVLICALRSLLPTDSKDFRKLTKLLVNEDDEGLDYFKLMPTQPDRDAYRALLSGSPQPGSRFARALEFFRSQLSDGRDSDNEPIDLTRMAATLQNRLTVVSIHLGDAEDPYLIFESLNAKGAPLTQADLIRNYLLLRLRTDAQAAAYNDSWLPMQALLGDHLTEFMRVYLMQSGEDVAKSAIYAVLKKRLLAVPDSSVADELKNLERAAQRYATIIGLRPADPSFDAPLRRLRRWEVSTANPFIMKLLSRHAQGQISALDVARCLEVVESFVIRRAVCSVATNQLKRIFLALAGQTPEADLAVWLVKTLAAGGSGRRWPRDDEFREAFARYRAYAQTGERCKLLLERLEEHHGHKEPASFENATIEHIMPQTLSPAWRKLLGDEVERIHEHWCDCFANLTLTAYNPTLSNSPFSVKRDIYADSNYSLTKNLAKKHHWGLEELEERNEELFQRARKIWPRD